MMEECEVEARQAGRSAADDEEAVAAEYVLTQTKLAWRVPEAVRREINAMLLRPATERPTVKQLRKDLRLKERFGIGEHMFREYARQVQAGHNGPMCGPLVTAMAHLLKVPVEQGEVLQEVAFVLLMMRLAKMLNDGGLTPEQVVKLADAMAKGQAAQTRAVERRLAEKRFRREGNQMRRPQVESQEELNERVRRIYGLDMAKCTRSDPPAATTDNVIV